MSQANGQLTKIVYEICHTLDRNWFPFIAGASDIIASSLTERRLKLMLR